MKFRPCIDLHEGKVVQIVGGSLRDGGAEELRVNHRSERSPADFARLYREDELTGGHVIALGPGNVQAALEALRAFPGGLQYGGGVTPDNALDYLDAGASHVVVTSHVFREGRIDYERLARLMGVTGREQLVLDLSCRQRDGAFWVVTDRWQRFTEEQVDAPLLQKLSGYCAEFLVHGVDVEGKMQGIEEELLRFLATHSPLPVTYAGGVRSLEDMERVKQIGLNRVDLTIGSALDLFGGPLPYREVVEWHKANNA